MATFKHGGSITPACMHPNELVLPGSQADADAPALHMDANGRLKQDLCYTIAWVVWYV